MIQDNLENIKYRIEQAAISSKRRAQAITLLAVSKTQPVADIKLLAELGVKHFAENRVQEALPKIITLQDMAITWHFIGRIQSNKTKIIAENFAWVQSLSDERHAERLNKQRPLHLPPLNVCLQFNISQELSKSGVKDFEQLMHLASVVKQLPRLQLRGLMALPLQTSEYRLQQESFVKMHELFLQFNQIGFELDTLSMGMSNDFVVAIQAGATMIRIGSALFAN